MLLFMPLFDLRLVNRLRRGVCLSIHVSINLGLSVSENPNANNRMRHAKPIAGFS